MEYDYIKVREYQTNIFDVSEEGNYYVLSFVGGRHIKVSQKIKTILEKCDGTNTVAAIVDKLKKNNIILTSDDFTNFVSDYLIKNNIVENQDEKSVIKQQSRLWFHLPILKGEKLSGILRILKYFYKKKACFFLLAATFVINLYLLFMGHYSGIIHTNIYELNSLGILILLYLSFVFHEIGHAAAAVYYDIKVGDMGVGLYLFRPVFYADLSNAWILDRKKRVVIDLGGVYFQIIFILCLSSLLLFMNTSTLRVSIMLIFVSILGNLNPVLRYDGYWILTDLLGIVNISKRAFEYFRKVVVTLFKEKRLDLSMDHKINKSLRGVFYAYVLIYSFFTVLILGIGIFFVIQFIVKPEIVIKPFNLLIEGIQKRDINLILKRANHSLIFLLPLVYLILMLLKTIGNLVLNKKSRRKKINENAVKPESK